MSSTESGTVSVLLRSSALSVCVVPNVKQNALAAARRGVARAGCRIGTVRSVYSKSVRRGRVISQKPDPRRVLPSGGKVDLLVSLGRKR